MTGIVCYGAYIPYFRLSRAAIAEVLGGAAATGTRAVASYDEDTTSMAVEATRDALRRLPPSVEPSALVLATANPAYLDKTNATAVHAAVGLDIGVPAYDAVGASRSAVGALRNALLSRASSIVVASDIRTGLPGGADEAEGGDAAVAFVIGSGDSVIAELVGTGAATAEFLDRWRAPGADASSRWEERFGEQAYVPLAELAVTGALKDAGVSLDDVDHVVVAGLHGRATRAVAKSLNNRTSSPATDLLSTIGNCGTAHFGLALADVLDRADPGQLILAVSLADGAAALVFRTTQALQSTHESLTVAQQAASGDDSLPYASFLTWRGLLFREPPRRPEPVVPAAPPSFRAEHWKFAFAGSRCDECGTRQLPPQRVCVQCGAFDQMTPESFADRRGAITTYSVDRLAFSLNPPVVACVVDFDGGGRFQCELTDVDAASVAVGDRVEMTFRRLYTSGGVHNYFWKARPVRGHEEQGG